MTDILVVDDHLVVLEGLKALIHAQTDMRVVAEATDAEAALACAQGLKPDVLIGELFEQGTDAGRLIERVRQACPSVRVLVLTAREGRDDVRRCLAAGASGYVLKRAETDALFQALRTVAAGGTWIDPLLFDLEAAPAQRLAAAPSTLSVREEEVLRSIARGFSGADISLRLGVSVKSVETYKSRALAKLGLRSRVDIIRYGMRCGWLQEP